MSSVSEVILSMRNNLERAYSTISDKGGIIPDNKNLENLSDSINSISGGSSEKASSIIDKSVNTMTESDFGDISTIGSYVFSSCTSLIGVEMPNTITSIGSSAFLGCSNLSSVIFSDAIETIGSQAFLNCTSITSIDLGENVTSIGSQAFNSCNSLLSFTVRATTPPSLLNSNALSYTNNCPIYVPAQSVNAYKTETNWIAYASRIQAIQ